MSPERKKVILFSAESLGHGDTIIGYEALANLLEVLIRGNKVPSAIVCLNPAVSLGRAADFGTIAVGMRADMILLDANPLENIGALRRRGGVMVAGTWLSAEEIEERLAKSSSAQMPVRKSVKRPAHVKSAEELVTLPVNWARVAESVEPASEWLSTFLGE